MVDREMSPEGYKQRCTYCGKLIVEEELVFAAAENESVLLLFCSRECADEYVSATREASEEDEDIFRAGAT